MGHGRTDKLLRVIWNIFHIQGPNEYHGANVWMLLSYDSPTWWINQNQSNQIRIYVVQLDIQPLSAVVVLAYFNLFFF